jgi:hypothetical protein
VAAPGQGKTTCPLEDLGSLAHTHLHRHMVCVFSKRHILHPNPQLLAPEGDGLGCGISQVKHSDRTVITCCGQRGAIGGPGQACHLSGVAPQPCDEQLAGGVLVGVLPARTAKDVSTSMRAQAVKQGRKDGCRIAHPGLLLRSLSSSFFVDIPGVCGSALRDRGGVLQV